MKYGETKIGIIKVIASLCSKYHKTYCWPSRSKILSLLKKYQGNIISLSCLDKHLADLNGDKVINSFQRHGQNPNGTYFNKTSNRSITSNGIRRLVLLGIFFSPWLYKAIIKPNPPPKRKTTDFFSAILQDPEKSRDEKAAAYSALTKALAY